MSNLLVLILLLLVCSGQAEDNRPLVVGLEGGIAFAIAEEKRHLVTHWYSDGVLVENSTAHRLGFIGAKALTRAGDAAVVVAWAGEDSHVYTQRLQQELESPPVSAGEVSGTVSGVAVACGDEEGCVVWWTERGGVVKASHRTGSLMVTAGGATGSPAAAAVASGFVVMWAQDEGLYLRRHDPSGGLQGDPMLLSVSNGATLRQPAMTVLQDGRVAAAWLSTHRWQEPDTTAATYAVIAAVFDPTAPVQTRGFLVSDEVPHPTDQPSIASTSSDFVVGWIMKGALFTKIYDIATGYVTRFATYSQVSEHALDSNWRLPFGSGSISAGLDGVVHHVINRTWSISYMKEVPELLVRNPTTPKLVEDTSNKGRWTAAAPGVVAGGDGVRIAGVVGIGGHFGVSGKGAMEQWSATGDALYPGQEFQVCVAGELTISARVDRRKGTMVAFADPPVLLSSHRDERLVGVACTESGWAAVVSDYFTLRVAYPPDQEGAIVFDHGRKLRSEVAAHPFSIAGTSKGRFAVVWSTTQGTVSAYLFGGGLPNASVFWDDFDQRNAVVSAVGDGFVVAWESTAPFAVKVQRLDASGNRQGGSWVVNDHRDTRPSYPSLSSEAGGKGFIVSWRVEDGDVRVKSYASDPLKVLVPETSAPLKPYPTPQAGPVPIFALGSMYAAAWASDGTTYLPTFPLPRPSVPVSSLPVENLPLSTPLPLSTGVPGAKTPPRGVSLLGGDALILFGAEPGEGYFGGGEVFAVFFEDRSNRTEVVRVSEKGKVSQWYPEACAGRENRTFAAAWVDGERGVVVARGWAEDSAVVDVSLTSFEDNVRRVAIGCSTEGFAVAWVTARKRAAVRLFSPSGTPLTDSFHLADSLSNAEDALAMAGNGAGTYKVAWVEKTGSGREEIHNLRLTTVTSEAGIKGVRDLWPNQGTRHAPFENLAIASSLTAPVWWVAWAGTGIGNRDSYRTLIHAIRDDEVDVPKRLVPSGFGSGHATHPTLAALPDGNVALLYLWDLPQGQLAMVLRVANEEADLYPPIISRVTPAQLPVTVAAVGTDHFVTAWSQGGGSADLVVLFESLSATPAPMTPPSTSPVVSVTDSPSLFRIHVATDAPEVSPGSQTEEKSEMSSEMTLLLVVFGVAVGVALVAGAVVWVTGQGRKKIVSVVPAIEANADSRTVTGGESLLIELPNQEQLDLPEQARLLGRLFRKSPSTVNEQLLDGLRADHVTSAPGVDNQFASIVFTDIKGSTALWEAHQAVMQTALEVHNQAIRTCIVSRKGYEVKTIGDAFMVACHSLMQSLTLAMSIQESLYEAPWSAELLDLSTCAHDPDTRMAGLRVRIGVSAGPVKTEVNPTTQRFDYYGTTVNTAARLEGAAVSGTVCTLKSLLDKYPEQIHAMDPFKAVPMGKSKLKGLTGDVDLVAILPASLAARTACVLRADQQSLGSGGLSAIEEMLESMSRERSARGPLEPNLEQVYDATLGYIVLSVTQETLHSNRPSDVLQLVTLTAKVLEKLEESQGSVISIDSASLTVMWRHGETDSTLEKVKNPFTFLDAVKHSVDDNGLLSIGLVTGTFLLDGKTVIGELGWLAQHEARAAADLETLCLYATPQTLTDDVKPYIRPVETWRPVNTSISSEMFAYEVNCGALPMHTQVNTFPNPLSSSADWGWSHGFWEAYALTDTELIRRYASANDTVLLKVVAKLEDGSKGLWRY